MNKPQYAILLDGGFLTKKLKQRTHHFATPEEVIAECARIKATPHFANYELLRIFYYDAWPAKDGLRNPINGTDVRLSDTQIHSHFGSLLDKLELEPDFALRLGQAVTHGWKIGKNAARDMMANPRALQATDIVPDIQQKGVDLRIGLDIARLALRDFVRAIVCSYRRQRPRASFQIRA